MNQSRHLRDEVVRVEFTIVIYCGLDPGHHTQRSDTMRNAFLVVIVLASACGGQEPSRMCETVDAGHTEGFPQHFTCGAAYPIPFVMSPTAVTECQPVTDDESGKTLTFCPPPPECNPPVDGGCQ